MKTIAGLVVGIFMATAAASARIEAAEISGAGSTFVYPILAKWSAAYASKTGNTVSYQSIGSAAGIAKIKAKAVDFGASDMPLSSDELARLGMGQFPIAIGGVVPVVGASRCHVMTSAGKRSGPRGVVPTTGFSVSTPGLDWNRIHL